MSPSETVQATTEAVRQIPMLIDAAEALLNRPFGWIALLSLLAWLFLNKNAGIAIDFFEKRRNKKLEQLDLYVSKPDIADENSIRVLKDLRDAHYFRVATGIYAESKLRSKLIELHNSTPHTISWTTIRRAMEFIVFDDEKPASIRTSTRFEKFNHFYNILTGSLMLVISVLIFIVFFAYGPPNFRIKALAFISSLIFIAIAMFIFSHNWPRQAADKINSHLQKILRDKS